ncbi:MAG: type IV-A pilus assembly ATPase PilB [Pseudomonadota bacterium]|nr:type IV-A pilus assembly ATPase PilB [Pseudomonadota bacterium]
MGKRGLGDLLVREKLLSAEQLERAKKEMVSSGSKLSAAISKLGYVTDRKIADYVAQQHGLVAIDLDQFEIEPAVLKLVPKDLCLKHTMLPINQSLGTLVVAVADPSNIYIRDDLRFLTSSKIEMVVASENSILNNISRYYETSDFGSMITEMEQTEEATQASQFSESDKVEIANESGKSEDAPVIKFVNMMMTEAFKQRASDIHIEPYEKKFRVRFRIDGVLHEKIQPPQGSASAITSRIKVMSKMDISEKRRPLDGRLKVKTKAGKELEFRVSSLPTLYGEKIVMRIIDKSKLNVGLGELGFEPEDLKILREAIHMTNGMVLVTGPTGSGKSMTIYSALNEINTPDKNICTAEDPIEMNLEGINQVQMHSEIGLDFSSALRSFLRQDPDIVFVGEIRDKETAEIGFKAASTGHLVVSTLHTNDAPSTIVRLMDMGVPPFLVNATVHLVVAQRLVGKICGNCKSAVDVPRQVLLDLGVPESEVAGFKVMNGGGCVNCNFTGIRGRLAVHEMMRLTPLVKDAIMSGATGREIRKVAVEDGMSSLRKNALKKLSAGLTTIEEVLSATMKD